MTIAATRAQTVAEILWELKRAEKLATLTSVAERAGFSPGAGSRTIATCLKTVRRDWPHLQWWRAIPDSAVVEEEQATFLVEAGFETESAEEGVAVKALADHLMAWVDPDAEQDAGEPVGDESA